MEWIVLGFLLMNLLLLLGVFAALINTLTNHRRRKLLVFSRVVHYRFSFLYVSGSYLRGGDGCQLLVVSRESSQ